MVKHRGRQTQGARQRPYLVPRRLALPPHPLPVAGVSIPCPALQDFQQNEELLWEAAEGGWRAGLDVRAGGVEGA